MAKRTYTYDFEEILVFRRRIEFESDRDRGNIYEILKALEGKAQTGEDIADGLDEIPGIEVTENTSDFTDVSSPEDVEFEPLELNYVETVNQEEGEEKWH